MIKLLEICYSNLTKNLARVASGNADARRSPAVPFSQICWEFVVPIGKIDRLFGAAIAIAAAFLDNEAGRSGWCPLS